MIPLGDRIRELRLKIGISQAELARGIASPSMISQLESNRVKASYKLLAQIAERLETSLEKLLSGVDLNLEFISNTKMARAMLAAKEYAAALPLLLELLQAPYGLGMGSRIEVLLDLAQCYLQLGDLTNAEKCLDEAKQATILSHDHHMRARVLHGLAQIAIECQRYQLAIYHLNQAIEELQQVAEPDALLQEELNFKRGQVQSKVGLVSNAIESYQLALKACGDENGSLYTLAKLCLELATTYRRSEDLELAVKYAERAAHLYDTLDRVVMKTKLQMECAIVYGQTDRREEAIQTLYEVMGKFQEMGKQTDEGIARIELARIQIDLGELDQVEENCQRARTLLPEKHPYQGWRHRILGEAALLRNDRVEAVRRFQRAADCFRSTERIDEWERTMYDLSRLYREDQKLDCALGIMDSLRNFTRQVLAERGIVL